MKYYVGVTDYDWYQFLSKRENEDINFWQPGGNTRFKAIAPGAPFLFKLKYPYNAIAGIGFFSSHSILPLDVAWNIFQERNGLDSFFSFRQKIINYRNSGNPYSKNPNIGCIVLTDPIFFEPADWITVPASWGKSIVQGNRTIHLSGKEKFCGKEWSCCCTNTACLSVRNQQKVSWCLQSREQNTQ